LGGAGQGDVGVAGFLEEFCEEGGDVLGAVAIAAEVAEDDSGHSVVGDFCEEFGYLGVGKVAVAGGDALLDGPGTLGVVGEELVVVVRLDEKGGEAAEAGFHGGGDLAGIGDEAEAVGAVSEDETYGIDGIMLDGEGLDG